MFGAWYPGVGWCIAILGFLGVVVTLARDPKDIGKREKALWIFIMSTLLVLELRSIVLDQRKHDKEQADARAEQLAEFDRIAHGIDMTIVNSQKQFQATTDHLEAIMQSTANVARLSRDSIDAVTGGSGFCYLIFTLDSTGRTAGPIIVHQGKHPLYEIDVRVVDLEKLEKKFPKGKTPASLQEFMAENYRFHVGELSSNTAFSPSVAIPFSESVRQDFRIFFSARNGYWMEDLSIRVVDGKTRQALRVSQEFGKRPKLMFRKIDKEFPLVDGHVDWRP
jgi:hypothetical protein